MRMIVVVAWLVAAAQVHAAEVVVTVSGAESSGGEIGCALFAGAPGFPFEFSRARQVWTQVNAPCRFDGVGDGRYAIAVMHDLAGDHKLDTNLFGAPTKPWGVSNGVRPKTRAPTFEEAAFDVKGSDVAMDVRLGR